MNRLYAHFIKRHFKQNRQMFFLAGPRQVGKTTLCELLEREWEECFCFNWDNKQDRLHILEGPLTIGRLCEMELMRKHKPLIVFDEIHKHEGWKDFLKGFFDLFGKRASILVAGSARLDAFRKSGDSLMGRYFSCRMHPLSVGELVHKSLPKEELFAPKKIVDAKFNQLLELGGFPEPFLRGDKTFYNRWSSFRHEQLFQEEIRELTLIQNLDIMEVLTELLQRQVGQLTSFSSLSRKLCKSDQTVKQWLKVLKNLYFCFEVKPWSKNVTRSLIKEPKYYLWDWSLATNKGARDENFIASHLHKAVHFWSDSGMGKYKLCYVRDKDKREVDFLVVKNEQPWMLVEIKSSDGKAISSSLYYFQKALNVPYAFQVVMDLPYVHSNCFIGGAPMKVPAKTFLSQLI